MKSLNSICVMILPLGLIACNDLQSTTPFPNTSTTSTHTIDWTNPGTIGSSTPNTGAFTTLSAGIPILSVQGPNGISIPTNGNILQVSEASTATSGNDYTTMFVNVPSNTSDSSAQNIASYTEVANPSNSLNYHMFVGNWGETDFNSTGALVQSYGVFGQSNNNTSGSMTVGAGVGGEMINVLGGTVAQGFGTVGEVYNNGSGSYTKSYGALGIVENTSTGLLTTSYGAAGEVINTSTGNITTSYGLAGVVENAGAGTITTAYGVLAEVANVGAGTITNAYGVYIPTIAGTTSYGVYESSTAENYFAGNVGIGNSSPARALDVTGDIGTTGCLYYPGGSMGTCPSDERLKKNVKSYEVGIHELMGIRPVTFQYRGLANFADDGKTQMGVIAQEVEKVAPSLIVKEKVKMHPEDTTLTEIKAVDYSAFTYLLINSVKSTWAKLNHVDDRVAALEKENAELKAKLSSIETRLNQMDQNSVRVPASKAK